MTTLTQKIPGTSSSSRQTFEFLENELVWRVTLSRNNTRELRFLWKEIPHEFHFRDVEAPNQSIYRLVTVTATAVATFIAVMRNDANAIWIALLAAMTIVLFLLVASRFIPTRRTEIPAKKSIVVYRDKFHDEILSEIKSRRHAYFAQMAPIDPEETVRGNLRRLRWLQKIRVLTRDEYLAIERELLPSNYPSILPAPRAESKQSFRQANLLSRTSFEMLDEHITYEREFVGFGRLKYNIAYDQLRPRKEGYETVLIAKQFTFAFYMCLTLCVIALDLWINPGLTHDIRGIFLVVVGLFLIAFLTIRISLFGVHQIMPGLYAFADKDGTAADILAEIEKRRLAARREMVKPDILLTKKERYTQLAELRRDGVISDLEFHQLSDSAEGNEELWLNRLVQQPAPVTKPALH